MHKAFECLLIFILYFRNNFHILHLVFSFDRNGKAVKKEEDKNKTEPLPIEEQDNNYPWKITRVNKNDLSPTQ